MLALVWCPGKQTHIGATPRDGVEHPSQDVSVLAGDISAWWRLWGRWRGLHTAGVVVLHGRLLA